jgi:hypothetical protein
MLSLRRVLLTTVAFLLLASTAVRAQLELPANQPDRDQFTGYLREICRDYEFMVVSQEAPPPAPPRWFVRFGRRLNRPGSEFPSDVTPEGCRLLMDIVNNAKTVKLAGDNTIVSGGTTGDAPADRGNGVGTGSTIRFNLAANDRTYFVFDSDGHKIKHPRVISLAHELLHAWHNLKGDRAADPESQVIDDPNAPITENAIRHEQSNANGGPELDRRAGHGGGITALDNSHDLGSAGQSTTTLAVLTTDARRHARKVLRLRYTVRNTRHRPIYLVAGARMPYVSGVGTNMVVLHFDVLRTTEDFDLFEIPRFIRLAPGRTYTKVLTLSLPLRVSDHLHLRGRPVKTSAVIFIRVVRGYGVAPFRVRPTNDQIYADFLRWQNRLVGPRVRVHIA